MRTTVNVNFTDAFSETDHPRKGGRFTTKGSGGGTGNKADHAKAAEAHEAAAARMKESADRDHHQTTGPKERKKISQAAVRASEKTGSPHHVDQAKTAADHGSHKSQWNGDSNHKWHMERAIAHHTKAAQMHRESAK